MTSWHKVDFRKEVGKLSTQSSFSPHSILFGLHCQCFFFPFFSRKMHFAIPFVCPFKSAPWVCMRMFMFLCVCVLLDG